MHAYVVRGHLHCHAKWRHWDLPLGVCQEKCDGREEVSPGNSILHIKRKDKNSAATYKLIKSVVGQELSCHVGRSEQ